jgi:hypothetical protein
MNILLLASHAVAEYDDIRMFTDLGHDVFCPGGYQDPRNSGEGIRPALPDAPYHPDLIEACEVQRRTLGDPGPNIDWAKARLHDDIIDWADVIIVHHFVDRWIGLQWDRIKHKRVVWRTCGQSNPELERYMGGFVDQGLQVVRYSPAEERFFGELGSFAGQTALIRFGKYPDDYGPWNGEAAVVGNITQHMAQRGDACGYGFWQAATEGLPVQPAGPGSEVLRDGLGSLSYEAMLAYLRTIRVYLYTGTTPASYTLGLIEAMLSGVPVVSIDAASWGAGWGGADLFEGSELTFSHVENGMRTGKSAVEVARETLRTYLDHPNRTTSGLGRQRAIDLFGIQNVGPQWQEFLS